MGDTSEATDLGCSATLDSLSELESFLVRAALGVVVAAPQRWFQDAVPAGDAFRQWHSGISCGPPRRAPLSRLARLARPPC